MNEEEKELVKEIELILWEMKLWAREGEDVKEIINKLSQELIVIIEEYKKEGR